MLRIKQLLYGDGLTLAGVRRKLIEERPPSRPDPALANIAELFGKDARERILHVKRGLRELSAMLSRPPGTPAAAGDGDFQLRVDDAPKAKAKPKAVAAPVKKKR